LGKLLHILHCLGLSEQLTNFFESELYFLEFFNHNLFSTCKVNKKSTAVREMHDREHRDEFNARILFFPLRLQFRAGPMTFEA
jgi:hypothetical protein